MLGREGVVGAAAIACRSESACCSNAAVPVFGAASAALGAGALATELDDVACSVLALIPVDCATCAA